MKELSREEVLKIARLARLELEDKEIETLRRELGAILGYVARLGEAGADNLDPTFQTLAKPTPMREDEPDEPLGADGVLANAPRKKDGFFVVPKVIE